jgi:hypothetical protein
MPPTTDTNSDEFLTLSIPLAAIEITEDISLDVIRDQEHIGLNSSTISWCTIA